MNYMCYKFDLCRKNIVSVSNICFTSIFCSCCCCSKNINILCKSVSEKQ